MSDTDLLPIESINVRLFSFALDCPRVWFLQAEAVFFVLDGSNPNLRNSP